MREWMEHKRESSNPDIAQQHSITDHRIKALRILHVANFEDFKYGQWYMGLDLKLSLGLTQLGHCVVPFSHRDVARAESIFKRKKTGAGTMNKRLLTTIENFQPEIILLGHSELIKDSTLRSIRSRLPHTKIAMWYCDPLFHAHGIELLKRRMHLIDALFTTTGGKPLSSLVIDNPTNCTLAHIPNWVYLGAESGKAFENGCYQNDIIFAGSDYHEAERQSLLMNLRDSVPGLRFKIFQALENPKIHGRQYYQALESSLIGLSLSRRGDVPWYTSDRFQQMLGNGLCTFSPRTEGLTQLFSNDEVVWFDNEQDLIEKTIFFTTHPIEAKKIASTGWKKVHQTCSAQRIAKFMLELINGGNFSENYEWKSQIFPAK